MEAKLVIVLGLCSSHSCDWLWLSLKHSVCLFVICRWQVGKVGLAASCSKFDATFQSSAYRFLVFVSINFADSSGGWWCRFEWSSWRSSRPVKCLQIAESRGCVMICVPKCAYCWHQVFIAPMETMILMDCCYRGLLLVAADKSCDNCYFRYIFFFLEYGQSCIEGYSFLN